MLFNKELRDEIVVIGAKNLLTIKNLYLNHKKVVLFNTDQLKQFQQLISELHAKKKVDFYSSVQEFWCQIDQNTEVYSNDIKEIFSKSIVENNTTLDKMINSNFVIPFNFFDNLSNLFIKSNLSYCKLSDKNLENFKILVQKISDLMKTFSEDCEKVILSFEQKGEPS